MGNKKTNLAWALYYQSLGLSIIPTGKNKKPLIEWKKYQDRCATGEEIEGWYSKWPDANPALVTGKVSGVVALDLDKKHNRTSKEFAIPPTASAKSGNLGEHFFFKYPSSVSVKSGSAISGDGCDCRADGGYILLAPSVNETGGIYEWIVPFESKEDLADMPEWFKKLTTDSKDEKKWLSGKDGVAEGSRNDTAASMAGKIISSTSPELLESIGWPKLQVWNQKNEKPIPVKELRGTWESIKKIDERNAESIPKPNSLLNEICSREDVTLFHDEQNEAFIALDISGHREVWPCKGRSMKRLLASTSFRRDKKPLSSESIKSMVTTLEGKACFEGEQMKLSNRAAWSGDELLYDLTNKKWQAVKINKDGWEVVDKPPILFRRYSHNKAQVIPSRNGDINLLLNYLNITNPEQRLLLQVFLVASFIPDFPHAMLTVFGAQGSSKSTLSKLLRMLVDPSMIEVAGLPKKPNELVQMLAHHYFLFFDNISYISDESSDTLCKAITGGGFSKRELFRDDDDIIYSFKRSIGVNGINLVTTRPDLLERSILLELERIEPAERKSEGALYEKFEKELPLILGGVFDVLVEAIKRKPSIMVESLPRMADWTLWGCAIAEALGHTQEDFLTAYQNNITHQTEMLLNDNVVAMAVFAFMDDKESWVSSPDNFLKALTNQASFAGIDTREKYWPKGANILSRRLNELSTPMKQMGISIVISTSGKERSINIQKVAAKVPPQIESPAEVAQPLFADDTDGISASVKGRMGLRMDEDIF